MRISQGQMVTNALERHRARLESLEDVQARMGSGRRIEKPSEGPGSMAGIFSLRSAQKARAQEARNGQEAWRAVQSVRFELVVSDQEMPQLTGVELCRRIRSEESTATIPVILLTAKSFEFDEDTVAELKLSALLPKPFSPRELVALVDRCLENHVVPQA